MRREFGSNTYLFVAGHPSLGPEEAAQERKISASACPAREAAPQGLQIEIRRGAAADGKNRRGGFGNGSPPRRLDGNTKCEELRQDRACYFASCAAGVPGCWSAPAFGAAVTRVASGGDPDPGAFARSAGEAAGARLGAGPGAALRVTACMT
jgi:hypothetical protein